MYRPHTCLHNQCNVDTTLFGQVKPTQLSGQDQPTKPRPRTPLRLKAPYHRFTGPPER